VSDVLTEYEPQITADLTGLWSGYMESYKRLLAVVIELQYCVRMFGVQKM